MGLHVGYTFIFKSDDGFRYRIKVVNVNEYRESTHRYGADITELEEGSNEKGVTVPDIIFFGDKWYEEVKPKIDLVVQ